MLWIVVDGGISNEQVGCEWVNVSSGTIRVVLDKGPLNDCVCVLYRTNLGLAVC